MKLNLTYKIHYIYKLLHFAVFPKRLITDCNGVLWFIVY